MRLLLVVTSFVVVACDPIAQVGIAVAPQPAVLTDSIERKAFAVGAAVAARHGLESFVNPHEDWWSQCSGKANFTLCGTVSEGQIQFRLLETFTSRFTPLADSVRRDLLVELRRFFGEANVRQCRWAIPRKGRPGCPLSAKPNTSLTPARPHSAEIELYSLTMARRAQPFLL